MKEYVALKETALKAGAWYSLIRFGSQVLSWTLTIYTARILSPEVFGLMAMAAFFTAQVEGFSDLGFGIAIIQKNTKNQEDLSSIFWFITAVGLILSFFTILLAYPTAYVFKEPKIHKITMMISPLFLLGSLSVVPFSILKRDFKFKMIGLIDFISMTTSSIVTVILALSNYGVYSLVVGLIVLRLTKLIMYFLSSQWRPTSYFSYVKLKPYLGFGCQVIMSGVFLRSLDSIDKLIVGRSFNASLLGGYGYAMSLASLPTQRIWPIFNELLLSTLSKLNHDKASLKKIFLSTLTYFLYIITPILFGGYLCGEEIIIGLLGEQWNHSVHFFKAFCISQFFFLNGVYFTVMNNAVGQPKLNLKYNFILSTLMLIFIYIASTLGSDYLIYPWILLIPVLVTFWIIFNIKNLKIGFLNYTKAFLEGIFPGVFTILILALIRHHYFDFMPRNENLIKLLLLSVGCGVSLYFGYFFLFKKEKIRDLYVLLIRR
ncbi:MAG: lipopolysaccharide biosynthesis protein [Trichloromonadaceae bacterium]